VALGQQLSKAWGLAVFEIHLPKIWSVFPEDTIQYNAVQYNNILIPNDKRYF